MSLCNKLHKLNTHLKSTLSKRLKTITKDTTTRLDLNTSIYFLKNLTFTKQAEENSIIQYNIENNINTRLNNETISPKDLFSFTLFSIENNISSNIVSSLIKTVHSYSSLFRNDDIQSLRYILLNNSKFTNIKNEILYRQFNKEKLFEDKSNPQLLSEIFDYLRVDNHVNTEIMFDIKGYDSYKESIHVKVNNKNLVFFELSDIFSIGSYKEAIKSYQPRVVLINNEPISNISQFKSEDELKITLRSKGDYRIRGLSHEVLYKGSLSISESIALYALSLKKDITIDLYDMPIDLYAKSFAESLLSIENNQFSSTVSPLLSVVNLSNLLFWLDFHLKEGCVMCNKKILVAYEPLSPEFFIGKSNLPNKKDIDLYRMKKINDGLSMLNNDEYMIIFCNDVFNEVKSYYRFLYDSHNHSNIVINSTIEEGKGNNEGRFLIPKTNLDSYYISNCAKALLFKANSLDYYIHNSNINNNSIFHNEDARFKSVFNKNLINEYLQFHGLDSEMRTILRNLELENGNDCGIETYFKQLMKISSTLLKL